MCSADTTQVQGCTREFGGARRVCVRGSLKGYPEIKKNRSSSRCRTPRPRGISRRADRPERALTETSPVTTFAGCNA